MKKWVKHWQKLANPSLRESPGDVADFLRRSGWAEPEGPVRPTEKAVRSGRARATADGVLWNKARYVDDRRAERRAAR